MRTAFKSNHIVRIMLLTMCMILTFIMMPWHSEYNEVSAASKTEKMIVYNKMIKKGNIVYVNLGEHIAAVNIKTKKVRTLWDKKDTYPVITTKKMSLKGNYLFFIRSTDHMEDLYRINLKTGKVKRFAGGSKKSSNTTIFIQKYAIKNNKVYYKVYTYNWDNSKETTYNAVKKINGKSSKRTSVKVKNTVKSKSANAKGYTIKKEYNHTEYWDNDEGESFDYYDYYLVTPDGEKILITTRWDGSF